VAHKKVSLFEVTFIEENRHFENKLIVLQKGKAPYFLLKNDVF